MTARILLMDDDALVLKTFEKLIKNEGYDVLPISQPEKAMESIRKYDFNLIISDIRMPGKDGVSTCKEIQKTLVESGKKDLPIIFITGFTEDGIRLNADFVGEVLTKPVDNDLLLVTIREYL